jgi:hypothetical protein
VPDRAILPLLPALSLGFICGIISAALQLSGGSAVAVCVAGGIATALAAVSSVFGVRGDGSEKAIVGGLRAACAVALFVSMYLFINAFLRNGQIPLSLVWLALILVFALVLTRLDVRDRGDASAAADQS